MRASLKTWIATLALVALPGTALAVGSIWPTAASPSLQFGWGTASYEGFDAIPDGNGGFWAAMDGYYETWVQHVLPSGRLAWPYYEVQVGLGGRGYGQPAIAEDGFGGVLAAWEMHGSTPPQDLRLQRVLPGGVVAPGWPEEGVSVCPSSDYDYWCDVVPDGSGGALVSFIRTGLNQVYLAHVLNSGTLDPAWPTDGVQVQPFGTVQDRPQLFSDGQGGAIVVYRSNEGGQFLLIAAGVTASGLVNPGPFGYGGLVLGVGVGSSFQGAMAANGKVHVVWTDGRAGQMEVFVNSVNRFGYGLDVDPSGLRLTTTPGANEDFPTLATDAAGNTVVAWVRGAQIAGTRLRLDLSVHPDYPAGGALVSANAGGYPYLPSAASDGQGGLLVTWVDIFASGTLHAQRLNPNGTIPPGWNPNGSVLATSQNVNSWPATIHDGERGIVGVFGDASRLAANRLRHDGQHGLLEQPVLAALNDVANDQGSRLALYWRASEIDTLPNNTVGSYTTWRRMPAIQAMARLAHGARVLAGGESPEPAGPGAIRAFSDASTTEYWEYLGSTPARAWTGYGMTVTTNSDLLGPGHPVPWETFMVEAVSPAGAVIGTSLPDSGYSLDNLSPASPAAFTAARAGGATHLHWLRSTEGDFREYRLHRGASAAFVPDDGNLVSAQSDTGFVDPALPGAYYKLAALDVHGNVSAYALVTPAQTLGVDDAAPAALAFAPLAPNPARGRVSLAYALPQGGHVRLEVFDTQGRRVASLVDATRAPGGHTEEWNLRGDGGRALAPGMYLARLETLAGARSRRFVVVE